jgi:putative serine protease PepD
VVYDLRGLSLNSASTGGAEITAVQENSPASRAGSRQGDVITAADGKAASSTQQFIETVDTHGPGQTLALTVRRGGSTLTIRLTLAKRPKTLPGR